MAKGKESVFDIKLFKRLLLYIKPYRWVFIVSIIAVIGLAVFGAIRPKVLQLAIDENINERLLEGFIKYIIIYIVLLVFEVISNLVFIYFASYLGQSVVRDIRVKLFKHILNFKMKYYDNSSVGILITRAVTDMERIADIFGQGLFMIFSDILKMFVVGGVMVAMNWRLSIIVFSTLPLIVKDFSLVSSVSCAVKTTDINSSVKVNNFFIIKYFKFVS